VKEGIYPFEPHLYRRELWQVEAQQSPPSYPHKAVFKGNSLCSVRILQYKNIDSARMFQCNGGILFRECTDVEGGGICGVVNDDACGWR
jgi:hypothetical protein